MPAATPRSRAAWEPDGGRVSASSTQLAYDSVRVFGSTVRGNDGPKSDVDLLVDVEPGRSLLDVIALEQDLEELLGRRVEVLTDGGLNPYLQERILTEAQAL